jgi:hypothetical protein
VKVKKVAVEIRNGKRMVQTMAKKLILAAVVAVFLLFVAGCAGEGSSDSGAGSANGASPGGQEAGTETGPGSQGDFGAANGTGAQVPEAGNETGGEAGGAIGEIPGEIACVPAVGNGSSVLMGIYKDYRYVNREGEMVYGDLYVGQTATSPYGPEFTLEGFRINGGTCESCDSEPENVLGVEAVFGASGLLDEAEPSGYYLEEGEAIHFCSLYNCTQEGEDGGCMSGRCEREAHFQVWDVQVELACEEETP